MSVFLDVSTAALLTFTAFACFILHVLSSPRRGHWIDLPEYIRKGLFAAGACVMYRGVNLMLLSTEVPPKGLGHVNVEGLIAMATICYTFTALTFHVLRRTFPVRVWDRLKYIEDLASCSNGGALALLASFGIKVIPPNAPPSAVKKASDSNV